ncbi:dienelactone hydrolase family protein [Promicromonospora sp. NPDC019610]|uniref:dienelactone hydrolase family protein n=1 Tax=Promicromonospora sp. NPDC019610 TaxID=3364405 RepID=UPI0037B521C3
MHPGHTSVPAGDGPFPGVVVVHDAYGMSAELRRVCDHLAAQGYLVHAPSMYQRGRCLRQTFASFVADQGPAYDRLEEARAALAARPDCTGRVGVLGFCLGGRFALVAAGRGGFDAAAVNYGLLPAGKQEPAELDRMLSDPCPVVASYGDRDRVVDIAEVDKLRTGLERSGVPVDLKVYPGATHSFLAQYTGALGMLMRVQGMSHDPEASADAWARTLAFFAEHLDGPTPAGARSAEGA